MDIVKILYSNVLDLWYNKHKLRISESTAYNYSKALPILKGYFSDICVQDITSEMCYDFVQTVIRRVSSQTSSRLYCKVLNMSLRYAVSCGYLFSNPVDEIRLPGRKRAEISPFSIEEIYKLLNTPGPQWVKDGIMISFRTGMRPGEIYVLKWSDISLSTGYISVQRAISRAGSSTKETKTPSGTRRIDIDPKLISYLRDMPSHNNSVYVFPSPPKGRHDYRVPWNVSKKLKEMCVRAGIPPRNFYSLRHSHATILFELGVHPKIVQERLGHSSILITSETYSHITPTIQRQAVDALKNI